MLVSWLTVVEDNSKAPFSIATTPKYRRGRYSFPLTTPPTRDPYCIILNVNQGGI